MKRPVTQRGVGLLELMLSLLVILTLIFMATRYFLISRESLRVSQAVDMINTTVNASYKWLEGNPDFSNISMQTLQTAGLVPDYFINPNANPWHGRIDVKESKNDSNKISVDLTNLSNNGCQSLQQKMLKYTSNNDASCVKQGGSTYQFTGTF